MGSLFAGRQTRPRGRESKDDSSVTMALESNGGGRSDDPAPAVTIALREQWKTPLPSGGGQTEADDVFW